MDKRKYLKDNSHKQSMLSKKLLFLCLILLFTLPFAFADNSGFVGENVRVWSYDLHEPNFHTEANATLTLYSPNGSIIVSEYNMTPLSEGIYYYDFVPNVSGNYVAYVTISDTTNTVEYFATIINIEPNQETNNMILAITLGLIGLAFLAAYLSHNIKLEEIPTGRIAEKALYYALSFIFFIGTPIFLLVLAENNTSLSYLEGFLSTTVIVTSLVGFAIMLFYIIYHFRKRIERLNKIKDELENDHTK